MDRPQTGTNPVMANRDREEYLEFVTSLFGFLPKLQPAIQKRTDEELASYRERTGHDPRNLDEAHEALDHVPMLATRHRFRRDIQEMKYYATRDDIFSREAELLAELDRADSMGPGSVEYDPNWQVPEYTTRDIHLLVDGYTRHPLAGYMYHYGTKVFFGGANQEDDLQRGAIAKLPTPADGRVRRVLDIGCSAGQSATAFKERFPEAEVWGIDIGIPMVRYAHKRAVDMGIDVHFAQRLSEDTKFPDNHFDMVHAFILFHELPPEAAEKTVAEAARILRPGGLFLVTDFPTQDVRREKPSMAGPLSDIYRDIDMRDNCEPYSWDFVNSDFKALLSRHFSNVEVKTEGLPLRICTK